MANLLARFAGKVCEMLLPIKHDIFFGNKKSSVAICTLSSMDLLEQIAKSEIMNSIALAARLFSENKGIEKLIKYVLKHENIRHIVLCGKDTKGHFPGQALLTLHKNGIDDHGRIVGAFGKDPVIDNVTKEQVDTFRRHINIIDLVGITDINEVSIKVASLVQA